MAVAQLPKCLKANFKKIPPSFDLKVIRARN